MAAKVLLVEDDNNLREIYEARLQAEGYAIVTAKDGEEALSVAKTELPDLVISDVMMPRVSGFEMLDILRNTDALKNTKVIMLTALGQADDKTRANSLGADRYLVKSQVTLEDIVKNAHELLEGAAQAGSAPGAVTPSADTPNPAASVPATPVAPTMPAEPPATVPTPAEPAMPVAPAPEPVMPPAAPAPVASAPTQPDPAAAPVSPAFSSLIGATPPSASPAPATPDSGAATTSEEEATVGAQIDSFVNDPNAGMTTAPAPQPGSAAVQDDAVLANAVNDLTASTMPSAEPVSPPTTMPAPEPPAPQPPAAASDRVVIANKKVIQPLSSPSKPDGEAPQADPTPAAPLSGMASFDPANVNMADHPDPTPPAPNTVFGPSQAPAAPTQPPATTEFDPNNISL